MTATEGYPHAHRGVVATTMRPRSRELAGDKGGLLQHALDGLIPRRITHRPASQGDDDAVLRISDYPRCATMASRCVGEKVGKGLHSITGNDLKLEAPQFV